MSRHINKLRTDYYVGVECGENFEVLIQKNGEFPYKAIRYFKTYKDDQTEMQIKVHWRNEPSVESEGWFKTLKLDKISRPLPKGSVYFEFCLWIDSLNAAYASMEELTTGKKTAWAFKGTKIWRFNKGEVENINEDVVKPPEIIGTKKQSEVKVELREKMNLLKGLREAECIESEYLDGIIKSAENVVDHKSTTSKDREMKEMIKEVEKLTSLFYKSEFKLERDLGYTTDDGIYFNNLMIPKDSEFPCKVVHVDCTNNKKFEFLEGEANWSGYLTGNPKLLGEINVDLQRKIEIFEVCMEICTSGVLYASVEHLETRKIFYDIIHKEKKCTKREVEEKIKDVKPEGTLRVANEEDMGKLLMGGKNHCKEMKKLVAEEFKRYELEIEGLMKAHQHKHFEEFQSFKLEIEEERKVNQQREMKIIEEIHELKEELKKMKMQLDKDVVKERAELIRRKEDLEKAEHEEIMENFVKAAARKAQEDIKKKELKSQMEELEKAEIVKSEKDLKKFELEKEMRNLEMEENERIREDLRISKGISEKFQEELKEILAQLEEKRK